MPTAPPPTAETEAEETQLTATSPCLRGGRKLGLDARASTVLRSGSGLRGPARERLGECPGHEPARARDVVRLEQHRTRRRGDAGAARRAVEGQVRAAEIERDVLSPPPGDQERVGGDGAVVAPREQRDRVDLEVEVGGENSASPVLPMNPSTSPAFTWRPLIASGE